MFAVDMCHLPATGGSTFVLIAGLFLLVAGVIVARWALASAGRLSVVVAPLVLLGGLVLAPQVADPCAPATTTVPSATTTVPSATTTVPSATTTVPSATTTVPSATTTTTSLVGAALTPTFGSTTATADGFTVQISNYSALYTWAGAATANGSVVVSGTGLITVSGVAAGTSSTATITTTRTGYAGGTATVTQTSVVGAALTPTFGTQTAAPGGFQVQISNYSALYTWGGTATASGSVAVSGTGLVTVMGVAYRTSSTATITTTRTGYTGGTATVTRTCASGGSCAVGDPGGGGGIIFYVDMNRPVGSQYFEAAPVGAEVQRSWVTGANQTAAVAGPDGTVIGTGAQNTIDIVAQSGNVAATSAAVYCSELVSGGQSDWFLPSKDELNQIFTNLYNVSSPLGGFSIGAYWSSSEFDGDFAWYQLFNSGSQINVSKGATIFVRPVRAF